MGGVGWSVEGVLCRGVFGCIVRVCGCFVSVVWEGVEFEEGEESFEDGEMQCFG